MKTVNQSCGRVPGECIEFNVLLQQLVAQVQYMIMCGNNGIIFIVFKLIQYRNDNSNKVRLGSSRHFFTEHH